MSNNFNAVFQHHFFMLEEKKYPGKSWSHVKVFDFTCNATTFTVCTSRMLFMANTTVLLKKQLEIIPDDIDISLFQTSFYIWLKYLIKLL